MLTNRYTRIAIAAASAMLLACVGGYSPQVAAQSQSAGPVATASHFRPSGSMTVSRASQLAVGLSDGKVLVVGGLSTARSGIDRKKAEIYDPSSGTFHSTGSLVSIDQPGNAVLMPDGTVLVYGIRENWRSEDETTPEFVTEIFDPNSGKFSLAPAMNDDRARPSVTPLKDGSLLFAGGEPHDPRYQMGVSSTATAEVYEPKSRTFSKVASMHEQRTRHSATLLDDGAVLIAGGMNSNGFLGSADIYDPATRQFRVTGSMTTPRADHGAARLADGRVIIFGGATSGGGTVLATEVYDPKTGRFSPSGEMYDPGIGTYGRREIVSMRAASLQNGSILMMNVANVGGTLKIQRATYVEIYDPQTGRSKVIDGHFTPREWCSVTPLKNGDVLITGGEDPDKSSIVYSSAELYLP